MNAGAALHGQAMRLVEHDDLLVLDRDAAQVAQRDAEIFGVSPDSVASHVKFREKYGLRHRLLADVGHTVADAYGTWVDKTYLGRTYKGVERTTFVIGPDGRVEHVFPRVKPVEHVAKLMEVLA